MRGRSCIGVRRASFAANSLILGLAGIERLRPGLAPLAPGVAAEHLGLDARPSSRPGARPSRARSAVAIGGVRRGTPRKSRRSRAPRSAARRNLKAPASRATRSSAAAVSGEVLRAAIARSRASCISASASRSSITLKCAGTLASNGKSCSSRSQKACRVWILRPPGVSIVRANNCRANVRSCGPGLSAPVSTIAARQRLVVEARPLGERPEDAARHVGGRGLGEGEAEDLRRAARRRAGGAARAGSGHASCRCRRWPTPRRRRGGSEAVACVRRSESGMTRTAAHDASPASPFAGAARRRPFLDPRQMVVVGEAAGEFRDRARQIGRRFGTANWSSSALSSAKCLSASSAMSASLRRRIAFLCRRSGRRA